jgi:aerobic carbon-monoxide dehydrogenase large subunit
MTDTTWIGKSVKRIEDLRLIQGQGVYLDDLKLESPLHMMVVRSSRAHARIRAIDSSEAQALPGVVAVIISKDVAHLSRLPGDIPKGGLAVNHPLLAEDIVRYVGEPIAVVLAESKMTAEDAALAVMIEYEDLTAVVNPLEALLDKTLLHSELGTNVAYQNPTKLGDPDSVFAKAYKIVGATIVNQRVAPASMEGRGIAAKWDGETLTIWSSTQNPHDLRDDLATALELSKDAVRVITPDVGGGFGAKIATYSEDVLVPFLAKHYSRPVKWVESRSENFLSMAHGRDQIADLEVACDEDARVLGLRGRFLADLGAYLVKCTAEVPTWGLPMMQGPYQYLQHFDYELVEVYTNKVPVTAYRGAGRPEATFFLERLMNIVASAFGLDPAEVRRRNFIPPEAFPYTSVAGAEYDSGEYEKALEMLLEKANYQRLRQEQRESRKQGRHVGIGLATYVECCAFGWERATVRVNQNGTATVFTGTSPHGQGAATGFAQIVAEQIGVDIEKIEVIHGDTKKIRTGQGTSGSRTLAVGGSAILGAAQKVREKLFALAAHVLEASPSDLELIPGNIHVRGVPTKKVSIQELANLAYDEKQLSENFEKGLEENSKFDIKSATSPFGAHLCVVEIHAATGEVEILEYICVDDCGVVMNPLLVDGQIHGGIAQAIGQALYEQVLYDDYGQNVSSSLMDYILPKAHLLPSYQTHRMVTPSPTNPLGVKGIGEAGTIGGTPAVANAVIDALEPLGIKHLDMPFWPQKLWQAMNTKIS